jgi:CHASE2 domain-containing sensor protein
LLTILIAIGFYVFSIAFFFENEAWFPFASFVVGLVMWGVTLAQYFWYYKKQ